MENRLFKWRLLAMVLGSFAFIQAVQATTLEVGTDEALPPFSFVQDGKVVGIDVEMLKEAAKRLKLEVNVKSLPWKRVLAGTESGELHLGMPLFQTPEREAFARFTGPIHYSTFGLFVKKGKEFKFDAIDDLSGKKFGISRGFVVSGDLDAAIKAKKVTIDEVPTIDQNILKLMAGRIDAFPSNIVSTLYLLKGTPESSEIVALPKLLADKRPAFLVVSKAANIPNKEQLIPALTEALEGLHKDGTYAKLVSKYVGK